MPWTHVADADDLALGDVVGVKIGERKLAIYRLPEGVYATSDMCPHLGACLSEGEVVDGFIECPAHFALFEIRTGRPAGGIPAQNLATFSVRVEQGKVYVLVD